jgi:hypothetical protein
VGVQRRAHGVAGLEGVAEGAEGGCVEHRAVRAARRAAVLRWGWWGGDGREAWGVGGGGDVAVDGAEWEADAARRLAVGVLGGGGAAWGGGGLGFGRRGGVVEARHELPRVDDLRLRLRLLFRLRVGGWPGLGP